jgi:Fur family ferric uptake transcriptional regulator
MQAHEEILKKSQLRTTSSRSAVLDYFLDSDHALSHAMIEEKLEKNFDRVTIYRTLRTFLDKGIIHRVLDDEGSPKYALCKDHCEEHEHKHNHVHLKCKDCGNTICIDSVEIPIIELPKGFTYTEADLLLTGTCKDCGN